MLEFPWLYLSIEPVQQPATYRLRAMLGTNSELQMGSRALKDSECQPGRLTYCSGISVAADPAKIDQRGKGKSDRSKLSTRQLLVVPVVPDDMRLKMAFSGGFIFLIL